MTLFVFNFVLNLFEKGMNPSVLYLWNYSRALLWQLVDEKKKPEIKPAKVHREIDLVSHSIHIGRFR